MAAGLGACSKEEAPIAISGEALVVTNGPVSADPGRGFACGLGSAGELYCWGSSSSGQLGVGGAVPLDTATPTRVGALLWTAASAGGSHACGITGGALYCWGNNARGQLGDNSVTNRTTPVRVGTASDWSAVSAGVIHTCGRRGSAVYCWGGNGNGQLGNGNTTDQRTPVLVSGAFAAVVAGESHSCALSGAGVVSCWGANTSGQLGLAGGQNRTTPAVISADTFTRLDAGAAHTCAIRADGSLWCTGGNWSGQLGDGTTTNRSALTRVGTAVDWASIATGTGHSCGLSTAGELRCFGSNILGEVGLGSAAGALVPTVVPAGTTFSVVTAGGGTCASGGGGLTCFGPNRSGELGAGLLPRRSTLSDVGVSGVSRAAFGMQHGCVVRTDGSLWCSGDNSSGQLGLGDQRPRAAFTRIGTGNGWRSVSAGQLHTCAVRTDDRGFCWGNNASGQLGDGTTNNRNAPFELSGTWERVVAGHSHTCGLRASDRAIFCWGNNSWGRLGDGTMVNRSSPVRAGTAVGYVALALGEGHSCALNGTGGVDCFGFGGFGALGQGNTNSSSVPVRAYNGALAVATGASTTCVLNGSAQVWCFGLSDRGQAGSGQAVVTTPWQPYNGGTWTQIAASTYHTCGVRNGAIACFGSNTSGQLGDGTLTNRTPPVVAANFVPASLHLGFEQTCAVRTDGTLWCVGAGSDGQFGDARALVTTSRPVSCALPTHGCVPSATCVDEAAGVACVCPTGLVGDGRTAGSGCTAGNVCTVNNGGCAAIATCTDLGGGNRSCACPVGYSGDGVTCADVDECLVGNGGCSGNAVCTNTVGSRSCACSAGYSGDGFSCADVDECLVGNGGCSANAACTNTAGGRTCACSAGYAGDGVTCADIDECLANNGGCSANAACTNTAGSRTCACSAGYAGNGVTCADVDECVVNNGGCSANAACTNTAGGRSCACSPGFVGDGVTCADVDECLVGNGGCSTNAACVNTAGSRSCACNAGYSGDGVTCADVDECLVGNGGCSANAACTNTAGGRTCACSSGFVGDGVTCSDVDECLVNNGGCSANAACTNTAGGRTCACSAGYAGDGVTCSDVDECLVGNGGCSANAACTNTAGGRTCACTAGYAGDGVTCADVNECLVNNGGCSADAQCANLVGGRACSCNSGFDGDGVTCADVDECLVGNGGCAANADCTNTPGDRTCECRPGYEGVGSVYCDPLGEITFEPMGPPAWEGSFLTVNGQVHGASPERVVLLEYAIVATGESTVWTPLPVAVDGSFSVVGFSADDGFADVLVRFSDQPGQTWVSFMGWQNQPPLTVDSVELPLSEEGLTITHLLEITDPGSDSWTIAIQRMNPVTNQLVADPVIGPTTERTVAITEQLQCCLSYTFVTVCDDEGLCASQTLSRGVLPVAPIARFDTSDSDIGEGLPITFTDASISLDGSPLTREWTWNFDSTFTMSTDETITITPHRSGSLEVCLNVTDDDGHSNAQCNNYSVPRRGPMPAFRASGPALPGQPIELIDESVSHDGSVLSRFWSGQDVLSDPTASTLTVVVPAGAATIPVCLQALDDEDSSVICQSIPVAHRAVPDFSIQYFVSSPFFMMVEDTTPVAPYGRAWTVDGVSVSFDTSVIVPRRNGEVCLLHFDVWGSQIGSDCVIPYPTFTPAASIAIDAFTYEGTQLVASSVDVGVPPPDWRSWRGTNIPGTLENQSSVIVTPVNGESRLCLEEMRPQGYSRRCKTWVSNSPQPPALSFDPELPWAGGGSLLLRHDILDPATASPTDYYFAGPIGDPPLTTTATVVPMVVPYTYAWIEIVTGWARSSLMFPMNREIPRPRLTWTPELVHAGDTVTFFDATPPARVTPFTNNWGAPTMTMVAPNAGAMNVCLEVYGFSDFTRTCVDVPVVMAY